MSGLDSHFGESVSSASLLFLHFPRVSKFPPERMYPSNIKGEHLAHVSFSAFVGFP